MISNFIILSKNQINSFSLLFTHAAETADYLHIVTLFWYDIIMVSVLIN